MTGSAFDSAWMKWGRAVVHAERYEFEIERIRLDPALHAFSASISPEYDPKRHGFVMTVDALDDLPEALNLILADIVGNYRCALDHVAWAMYERGTRAGQLTDRQERGIGFPECNDPATVDSIIRQRIPGIRPRDLATVRKRQPCRYAPRNRPLHVLPNLRRFSNTDKHRTLEVLYGLPTGGMMQITEQRDCEVPTKTRKAPTVPLQVGTEVGVIHAIKTGPHPEIDVEVTLSVQPAIHPRITVIAWMDKTRTWVASLLLALQRPAPTDRLVAIGVPRHLIP